MLAVNFNFLIAAYKHKQSRVRRMNPKFVAATHPGLIEMVGFRLAGDGMQILLQDTILEKWSMLAQCAEPCTGATSAFRKLEAPTYTLCLGCVVVTK